MKINSSFLISSVLNEVKILQSVSHLNVINLVDVIYTLDYSYIVLELAKGGELLDKIIKKTRFNETEAKLHFYQMASAMEYLHSKTICHRDLKPENILLCSQDDKNPGVKITDMGLSKLVDLGTFLKTFCGTPKYIAPEVIQGQGEDCEYCELNIVKLLVSRPLGLYVSLISIALQKERCHFFLILLLDPAVRVRQAIVLLTRTQACARASLRF